MKTVQNEKNAPMAVYVKRTRRDIRYKIAALIDKLAPLGILVAVPQMACAQYTALKLPTGYVQVQGDIITTEDKAAQLFAQMRGTNFSTDFTYAPGRLWPKGIVPYAFDISIGPQSQLIFMAAMAAWQNFSSGVSTPTFIPVTGSEAAYIYFEEHNPGFVGGSTDYVGYNGGQVTIQIHPQAVNQWLIAHEIGHALGLWHEQSRGDRGNYVTIVSGNIINGKAGQFDVAAPQSTFGPYDYDSIMQYGSCAFSVCNSCGCPDPACETIQAVPQYSAQQCNMGQRTHLSAMDQRGMAFMYAPPNWKFLYPKANSAATGTFQDPYTTLSQAVANPPANSTLWLGPGTYSATGMTIAQPMTLKAAISDLQLQPNGSLGPSPSGYATLQ